MLDLVVGLGDEILKFTMLDGGRDGAMGAEEGGEGNGGVAENGEQRHGFGEIGGLLALLGDAANEDPQELNLVFETGGV